MLPYQCLQLITIHFYIKCMCNQCQHIRKGWCGTKGCADSAAHNYGWNSSIERRSRVQGSVDGPFSHVAFLLSCVVSSAFKIASACGREVASCTLPLFWLTVSDSLFVFYDYMCNKFAGASSGLLVSRCMPSARTYVCVYFMYCTSSKADGNCISLVKNDV